MLAAVTPEALVPQHRLAEAVPLVASGAPVNG